MNGAAVIIALWAAGAASFAWATAGQIFGWPSARRWSRLGGLIYTALIPLSLVRPGWEWAAVAAGAAAVSWLRPWLWQGRHRLPRGAAQPAVSAEPAETAGPRPWPRPAASPWGTAEDQVPR